MVTNLGTAERLLRVAIGVGLIALALVDGAIWAVVGLAFVGSGALGNDPIYQLLGLTSVRGRRGTARS